MMTFPNIPNILWKIKMFETTNQRTIVDIHGYMINAKELARAARKRDNRWVCQLKIGPRGSISVLLQEYSL
jgi:hypothetical protein